jgi:multisubunit Na+/H+ antiporter MnhB subunit
MENFVFILVIVLFAAAYFASRSRSRRVREKFVETGKIREYENALALGSLIVYPLVGLVFITVTLANWNAIPPGNEVFAVMFVVFGLGMAAFGLYKWYRLRRSKKE